VSLSVHLLKTRDDEQMCAHHMPTKPKSRNATQPASIKLGWCQKVAASVDVICAVSLAHWSHKYMMQVGSLADAHANISCKSQLASKFNLSNFPRKFFSTHTVAHTWSNLHEMSAHMSTSGVALASLCRVHMAWVLLSTFNTLWLLCFSFVLPNS
jgi:hypothetical protein